MEASSLRRIEPGMSIQTQRGLGVIDSVDHQKDLVITSVGTYRAEEVEMVQRPEDPDPVAIDNWLNGPDVVVIPRYRSSSVTIECRCACGSCNRLQTFINGKPRTSVHMTNTACRCPNRGCPCVRA